MAQTRQQQVDKDERARLANDPKALKAYERSLEKQKETQISILASIEKEEKRHEMESFYSYVSDWWGSMILTTPNSRLPW